MNSYLHLGTFPLYSTLNINICILGLFPLSVAYPGVLLGGGGVATNSVEDRGQGSGVGSPLIRGSGGSLNFVQEISFYIVKSS